MLRVQLEIRERIIELCTKLNHTQIDIRLEIINTFVRLDKFLFLLLVYICGSRFERGESIIDLGS